MHFVRNARDAATDVGKSLTTEIEPVCGGLVREGQPLRKVDCAATMGNVMETARTIVLIEDDRETAATLVGVLESAGYVVQHAVNGIEGRQLVETHDPGLVITDMMMPGWGGSRYSNFCEPWRVPRG
ncbi:MAG: hypothetical protein Ct9H300mP1_08930 [Planctomycetaceae bacterium]|nr:MAG: hypothetical protein Ct9H300mP1_08930 [Planctomycetaceae bacterium]